MRKIKEKNRENGKEKKKNKIEGKKKQETRKIEEKE